MKCLLSFVCFAVAHASVRRQDEQEIRNASILAPSMIPSLRHHKSPGGGYLPSSPLYVAKKPSETTFFKGSNPAGVAVAVVLLSFLLGTPIVMLMAMSGGDLGEKTLALVQNIVVGMIAIFWYDAMDKVISDLISGPRYVIAALLHMAILMTGSVFFGWAMQDRGSSFSIFITLVNTYITFSAMTVSGEVQPFFPKDDEQPSFVITMFAGSSLFYVISVCLRKRLPGTSTEFHDKLDRCELTLIQTTLAYSLMHGLAALFSGKVNHFHREDGSIGSYNVYTLLQSLYLLGAAIACLAASLAVPKPRPDTPGEESPQSPMFRTFLNILGPSLFMCCGWGVWISLEWMFYGHMMPAKKAAMHQLGAAMYFTIIVFILCFGIIFVMDRLKVQEHWHASAALPQVMGIVAGLTVKRPFSQAGAMVAPGLMFKLFLAISASITLGPLWVKLIRPRVK